MVSDKFGDPVTEERWNRVDIEIRDFIRKYPLHWRMFKKDIDGKRSEYNVATEGNLAKSNFRNTASFPVVYRRKTDLEVEANIGGEDDDGYEEVASLYHILLPLLPGLTERDEKGHPNRLYREFLRRFPIFVPSEKN